MNNKDRRHLRDLLKRLETAAIELDDLRESLSDRMYNLQEYFGSLPHLEALEEEVGALEDAVLAMDDITQTIGDLL